MKIAIIGGTGKIGLALAEQLSKNHEVIIGSRDPVRAKATAAGLKGAKGLNYAGAAKECDVAIIAVPFSAMDSISSISTALSGKLVISVINPIKLEKGTFVYGLKEGSAAEILSGKLPESEIATAFNNVPASLFLEPVTPRLDIAVAADSKEIYDKVANIVRSIRNLRPLYAGPLSEAQTVERITPLVLNLAKRNETGSLGTRFVSRNG